MAPGREVRIKRQVASEAGGAPGLGAGAVDVTVTQHPDEESALTFAHAALGLALSAHAAELVASELERQCGANVKSRLLLRGWDCSVCSFGNRVENAVCEVCGKGRRPQSIAGTL